MRVFRREGFLTEAQATAIRREMDAGVKEQAEVLAGGISPDVRARVASLVEPSPGVIRSVESTLESCRDEIEAAFGLPLGDREGAGFIRYPPGGFYRPHVDRGDDPEWQPASVRAVAVVLFLNCSRASGLEGEFDGGVLRLHFAEEPVDVIPEVGLLVAFSADVLHEVTEVRGGTRDTIVDWFYDH